MEIVNIEARTFNEMYVAFQSFKGKVQDLCRRNSSATMDDWLDNQDVCDILNIAPRTLQSLRSNGTLAYSQIDRKTYYKKLDVMQLLEADGRRAYE